MNKQLSAHKRQLINGTLTVVTSERLSSHLIRIIFSSDKKLTVDPLWIGPHLKLLFPFDKQIPIVFPQVNDEQKIIWQAGLRERVRTYSIRDYQPADNTLTVDFVVHETGVATRWAQQAKPGDRIGLVAMGSKNRFDPATALLLVGDIAAMPAICYTLERLPAEQHAQAIIEVPSEQEQLTIKTSGELTWLVTPPNQHSRLADRVAALNLTANVKRYLCWGGMESAIAQSIRHRLKDRFTELSGESLCLISYWRKGYAEGQFKHHD